MQISGNVYVRDVNFVVPWENWMCLIVNVLFRFRGIQIRRKSIQLNCSNFKLMDANTVNRTTVVRVWNMHISLNVIFSLAKLNFTRWMWMLNLSVKMPWNHWFSMMLLLPVVKHLLSTFQSHLIANTGVFWYSQYHNCSLLFMLMRSAASTTGFRLCEGQN